MIKLINLEHNEKRHLPEIIITNEVVRLKENLQWLVGLEGCQVVYSSLKDRARYSLICLEINKIVLFRKA